MLACLSWAAGGRLHAQRVCGNPIMPCDPPPPQPSPPPPPPPHPHPSQVRATVRDEKPMSKREIELLYRVLDADADGLLELSGALGWGSWQPVALQGPQRQRADGSRGRVGRQCVGRLPASAARGWLPRAQTRSCLHRPTHRHGAAGVAHPELQRGRRRALSSTPTRRAPRHKPAWVHTPLPPGVLMKQVPSPSQPSFPMPPPINKC